MVELLQLLQTLPIFVGPINLHAQDYDTLSNWIPSMQLVKEIARTSSFTVKQHTTYKICNSFPNVSYLTQYYALFQQYVLLVLSFSMQIFRMMFRR